MKLHALTKYYSHNEKTSCKLPLIFLHLKLTELTHVKQTQIKQQLYPMASNKLIWILKLKTYQFLQTKLHSGDQILNTFNCTQKEKKQILFLNSGIYLDNYY